MSNSVSANVVRVDTTASLSVARRIHSIKYIGSAAGAVVITNNDDSNKLWEESGSSNTFNHGVSIEAPSGVTVTVTSSAVAYLYLGLR